MEKIAHKYREIQLCCNGTDQTSFVSFKRLIKALFKHLTFIDSVPGIGEDIVVDEMKDWERFNELCFETAGPMGLSIFNSKYLKEKVLRVLDALGECALKDLESSCEIGGEWKGIEWGWKADDMSNDGASESLFKTEWNGSEKIVKFSLSEGKLTESGKEQMSDE